MQAVNRLYGSFRPDHYLLKLNLQRAARTFSGTVQIKGQKVSDQLSLHAKDLTISELRVDGEPASFEAGENDELNIQTNASGDITIDVIFSGKITDSMHGLYPCYFEDKGTKKELLATQFESHHAREVFPCVDEPEAKATFDLTLVTETGVTVLGNMPVSQQETNGSELTTTFETSPRMSTYLLAFAIGDLIHKETTTKDGVLVRVFASPAQKAESLDFALDVAKRTIEFFDDYFGVPYPLPKSDHIALPDFSSGAMENWGLITYRETCLLVDPENTSIPVKEFTATVIAHELSHQWFGNLVTMRWWDDLWLNESFATLMEYIAIDALYPEWNIWMSFATSETLSAQRRDSLPGVQAVRTGVNHPDEISTLFDPSIVYAKGSKLLKMLYGYIGEEAFVKGLQTYFEAHAYGNTEGADLWRALGEAAGKDLESFMLPWLNRPGYPLVSVNQSGKSLQLSQKRFLLTADETESTDNTPWPVPLATIEKLPLFDTATTTLELQSDDPIKLNVGDNSFFLSRYETTEHRQALKERVANQSLAVIDRLQLLNESSMLARAGESSIVDTFDLLEAYVHEEHEPVWDIIGAVIADARRLIEDDEATENILKAKVRNLVETQYQKLGWQQDDGESAETTKLRSTILGLAVWAEHEQALPEALRRFEDFTRPEDVPADLRSIVFSAGAKHRGEVAFKKLLALHNESQSAEERQYLCMGMTSAREPAVIDQMLKLLRDPKIIRPQDVDHWYIYLLRNRYARRQTWQWMVDNWDWIERTFGSDKSYDNFVRYSASSLTGRTWLDTYKQFFEPKKSQAALKRVIEIGIVDISARTAWLDRDSDRLKQYLATKP